MRYDTVSLYIFIDDFFKIFEELERCLTLQDTDHQLM